MDIEDGQLFIKNLVHFIRTHEKALANALQLRRQQIPKYASSQRVSGAVGSAETPGVSIAANRSSTASSASTSSTFAAALSLPYLSFASHNIKPAKLALTPHHLFYLLSRFDDLGIQIGPMNVRLENLHSDTTAGNYVSFLSRSQRSKGHGSDSGSIHSVSSVRSVMSGMSSLWSNFGLGSGASAARTEKQRTATEADLKYLYSAFTKIPCLRLSPDRRARLIEGYEEFPFDTAVPLLAFKNVSALEISDIDIRQFFGWDRLAEQLRSLTVKRAGVDDPGDLLINILLDDMDRRRRRSSKVQISPTSTWAVSMSPKHSPTLPNVELVHPNSAPGSPDGRNHFDEEEGRGISLNRAGSDGTRSPTKGRPRSNSPARPNSSRTGSAHEILRGPFKIKRSRSGSSHSSMSDGWQNLRGSSSNLLSMGILPPSKWRFLKHLSLAENGITSISVSSLVPLADTLHSLDLSSNLFSQIPDCLASLTALRALNLSNCMIDSLHSLTRNPLPAITALNLRSNRLISIAGVERLYPLERLDLRDNNLNDPTELARLTGIPDLREIWVAGNTFTRTHSSHRITIFNLFRKIPGYSEDILIDTYGPSYTERRHLVDYVAERPNVPVVKPPPPNYGLTPVDVNKPVIEYPLSREPSDMRKERHTSPTALSDEHSKSSGRKRRTPKRRIVDLSTPESSPSKLKPLQPAVRFPVNEAPAAAAFSPDPSPRTLLSYMSFEPRHSESLRDMPRIDAPLVPRSPPTDTLPSPPLIKNTSSSDPQASGDMYRKKIEALRSEAGNDWLSVLSEEGREARQNSRQISEISQSTARTNSQQIVQSARTSG